MDYSFCQKMTVVWQAAIAVIVVIVIRTTFLSALLDFLIFSFLILNFKI